jgi:hypothetical protein
MSQETVDREEVSASGLETGCVETNDVETYYERRGEGPPVVFVHGMAMTTTMWEPEATALADHSPQSPTTCEVTAGQAGRTWPSTPSNCSQRTSTSS